MFPNGPEQRTPTAGVAGPVPGPSPLGTPQARPPAAPPATPELEHPGTPHTPVGLKTRRTLRDVLADEMAAVESGQAEGCGHLCDCHSPHHPCLRAAHPDADHNRVPHVARLGDGTLTQWTGPCPPVVDPQLQAQMDAEAETHRQAKAAEHAELIQAMFAAIGAHKKATGKLPWE